MSYPNGKIPADALSTVSGGALLLDGTAHSFKEWQAACAKEDIVLTTWGKYAGYRSVAVQGGMQDAYDDFHAGRAGGRAEMSKYGMDTSSRARPANAGTSRHGDALALDIRVTKGSQARARTIGKKFGWSWPFGDDDRNHMLHDGKTAISPKPASTKKVVTVKPGDTLGKIAAANKTTVAKILALPQTPKITDPDIVKVGQKVRVK